MSAGYKLVDYLDIQNAILEELKVPATDGVTLSRIKRDINIIYLNHVIPFKPRAWNWLELKQDITTYEKIIAGTITVTEDSTTITFSSPPTISLTGYYVKLLGQPEVVKITSHTALAANATISTAWCLATASGASYKAWKDYAPLDATMKDVILVTNDRLSVPLDAMANAKFAERRARLPEFEGPPTMYNFYDFDSDGNRQIRWFPACWDTRVNLHIEGRQEATALSADADEPLMPVEDRIVLFYGACSRAWRRERNESEAASNWNMFLQKLSEMAGKSGDAPIVTEMRVDPDYTMRKRYRRTSRGGRRFESD
jgi:hypothetical protein